MKTIKPSEIIDPKRKNYPPKGGQKRYSPAWVRFFARMFDYSLLFLAIYLIEYFFLQGKRIFTEWFIPLQLVIWIPIEAFFTAFFQKTPGKWLLGAHVTPKMDYKKALSRAFSVWFRGMGLGLMIVSVFTMFNAFTRLKTRRKTSWDLEEKTDVPIKPIHPFRMAIAVLFSIFIFYLYN